MAHAAAKVAQRCQTAQDTGHLDLSNCELAKFPEGIFMLMQNTAVKSLNLSRNILKAIPPKLFRKWENLEAMDLSHNQLLMLPAELQNLEQLVNLDISGNEFNHVPLVVFSLSLTSLAAHHNKIEEVAAEELKSMSNLLYVDLQENPLSDSLKAQLKERDDWHLLI